MRPTLGMLVWYRSFLYEERDVMGHVTRVRDDGEVDLVFWLPGYNSPQVTRAMFGPGIGCWRFPELPAKLVGED